MERAVAADKCARYAFAASLWKRAAAAALALYGEASLASAWCTLEHVTSLSSQASVEELPLEKRALEAEAWAVVSTLLPLLSTRMDDNTLLPGRCTKEEVEFFKCLTTRADATPLSARALQLVDFGVGYAVAIFAARRVLFQLYCDPRPSSAALAFVLRAVDMVRSARHAAFVQAA